MQASSTTAAAAAPPRAQGRFQALSALRQRNYLYYWIGILGYTLSIQIAQIANGWLVYELTNSPAHLGLIGLSAAAPTILLTVFGGVVADMTDRRRLVLITQTLSAIVALAIAYLSFAGQIQIAHLFVAAFLAGAFQAFDQPARIALLPQLIEPDTMMNAIALQSVGWQITRIAGPAIGGVVISLFGVGTCYLLVALSMCVMIWAMAVVKILHPAPPPRQQNMAKNMAEGFSFIRGNPVIMTLIAMTFFNSIFGMSYAILMPVFARDVLGSGSEGFGILMGATGVGALLGSGTVATLGNYKYKGRLLLIGATAFGLTLISFSFSQSFLLSTGILVLVGIANSLYMTTVSTILQSHIPNELRGRVMAVYTLCWSLIPLGGMIGGGVATVAGAPIAVAAGGVLVAAMALWASRFPQVRRL